MTINKSILLNSDSYKFSQAPQYPEGTTNVYDYIESRGGTWKQTVFFGLQMFLKEYLTKQITQEEIDLAEEIITAHGEPFYREGWEYILKQHNGYLPVRIKAVPEGTIVSLKNVLVTVENTDPNCWWLTSFLETSLLRSVWYPTTVATNSYESKRIILDYLNRTGDPSLIDFKLHDFSSRGVSSFESGGIGGISHLVNFKGTDNVTALLYGREYYNIDMAGFSIPASEHSIECSHATSPTINISTGGSVKDGKNELAYIRRMLEFLDTYPMVSIVGDAYNIYNFAHLMGSIKDEIIEKTKGGKFVILRPDCYDDKTQILTPFGWKFFSELTQNDLVAQVKEDKTYEFVKPLEIINQPYKGDMYEFRDFHGKVDLLVTANHRMVYENQKGVLKVKEASEFSPYWDTKKLRAVKAQTKEKELTWHEKFLIALQADGCIKTINSKSIKIEFNFTKNRKHERLLNILKNLNYPFNVYYLKSRQGQSTFDILVPVDIQLPISKTFDWVDISNLDSLWCEQFIEELKHWDSSIRNEGRFKYDTTIKQNIDIVEYIAISAGKGILVSVAEDNRKKHFSDVYTAHILDDPYAGGQSITKTKVDYDGTVHCVKVPSGMVLVKRNRGIVVSGNSGYPPEVVVKCLQILDEHFGHTVNDKGFKVLNHVRIIQGDGITQDTIDRILYRAMTAGYSADNVAFGQGGKLLQGVDRDTQKFAMKCSSIVVNGEQRDVYKSPITDMGKESKKGRVTLYKNDEGYFTDLEGRTDAVEVLETVFENGKIIKEYTFDEVRKNASEIV